MKEFNYNKTAVAISICVFCTNVALAQETQVGAPIKLGAFDLVPSLDVGVNYDDNVTKQNEDAIDTWARFVAPEVSLFTSAGASDFVFNYRIENEDHFSSEADNYTDHFLNLQAQLEFDVRNRLGLTGSFVDSHEERGSGFSIGEGAGLAEPDRFKRRGLQAQYGYGAPNATGRLELNVGFDDLDYDINTDDYRARDRETTSLGGTFLYKIGAATDATFDLRRRYIDYDFALDGDNPLDSRVDQILIGVSWEATAQTTGSAKIGYQSRTFDSSAREDFDGVDWEVGIVWQPLQYAEIEFSTSSDTDESNGLGDFIERDSFALTWRHVWAERLRSSAGFTFSNDVYGGRIGDEGASREDDNTGFSVSLDYQLKRWVNVEIGYNYSERSSNNLSVEFDRNQIFVNTTLTL